MEPSCVLVNQDWSVFNDLNVDFNETKCLKLIDIAIKDKIDKLWANDEFRTASAIFDKEINKTNFATYLKHCRQQKLDELFQNASRHKPSFSELVYEISGLSKLKENIVAQCVEPTMFLADEVRAFGRMQIKLKVLDKKITQAMSKQSGLEILETCVIEEIKDVPPNQEVFDDMGTDDEDMGTEYNTKMPHFPFILNEHVPDSVPSTHSISSLKPDGLIILVAWPKFRESFDKFFQPNKKNAPLTKLHQTPPKHKAIKVAKEPDVTFVLRNAIADTILEFYKDKKIELTPEHILTFGRPDFCILKDDLVYIAIECKHPKTPQPRTREELISIFMQQFVDNTTLEKARPVNQIVNYLVGNSVKRGILTNLEGCVAFELEVKNDRIAIKVSDFVPSNEILKLLAFLLDRALNDNETDNAPRFLMPTSSNQIEDEQEFIPPKSGFFSDQSESNMVLRDLSGNYPGIYNESADTFKMIDDKKLHQVVYDHFKEWKLDIPREKTIVGRGRTGLVSLANVYHIDKPDVRYTVAVKCGDFMKIHSLKKELLNEARVIKYANNMGLKCVPQLHYSGYFGYGGLMYINCTRYIEGYRKELSQLNKREQYLLKSALAELRLANIVHNDIKTSNILFTATQCFIIDFGASLIQEQNIIYEKLEFDPNVTGNLSSEH